MQILYKNTSRRDRLPGGLTFSLCAHARPHIFLLSPGRGVAIGGADCYVNCNMSCYTEFTSFNVVTLL